MPFSIFSPLALFNGYQALFPPSSDWDLRGHASYMHDHFLSVLHQQEQIGWLSGLKGFLGISWLQVARMSMCHSQSSTSTIKEGQRRRLRLIMFALHELTTTLC